MKSNNKTRTDKRRWCSSESEISENLFFELKHRDKLTVVRVVRLGWLGSAT